jgi:hypothetical protein
VHVWECTAAYMRGQISIGRISPTESPPPVTPSVCTQWAALRMSDEPKEAAGLRLLDQLEKSNCISRDSRAINCNLLAFIKHQCGGSFTISGRVPGLFDPKSQAVSSDYDEQRVTGFYIGTGSADDQSLKAAFETFMANEGGALKGSSAIKNTLQVDGGEHELTISAGTRTGDVSVFTHFTRKTNSLFVILYVGHTKGLEYGKKILKDFLDANRGIIRSLMVSTSTEEKAEAARSEQAAERMLQQNSQVASFALDLLCQVPT